MLDRWKVGPRAIKENVYSSATDCSTLSFCSQLIQSLNEESKHFLPPGFNLVHNNFRWPPGTTLQGWIWVYWNIRIAINPSQQCLEGFFFFLATFKIQHCDTCSQCLCFLFLFCRNKCVEHANAREFEFWCFEWNYIVLYIKLHWIFKFKKQCLYLSSSPRVFFWCKSVGWLSSLLPNNSARLLNSVLVAFPQLFFLFFF